MNYRNAQFFDCFNYIGKFFLDDYCYFIVRIKDFNDINEIYVDNFVAGSISILEMIEH